MTLLDAIPHGRTNARTKAALAAVLGVSSREVESEIERLRKSATAAICSDGGGYWRPLTSQELTENVDRRRRRALSQLVTVRGERRYARQWAAREALPLAFSWTDAA